MSITSNQFGAYNLHFFPSKASFLFNMLFLMSVHVGPVGKPLIAVRTSVGLFSRMRSHMLLIIILSHDKTFWAKMASVGLRVTVISLFVVKPNMPGLE